MSAFLRPRTWDASEYPSIPDLNIISSSIASLLGRSDATYGGFPRARVRSSAAVGLATKQWTTLTFDTVVRNVGGLFIGEQGSSLVVPWAGTWRVGASVDIENVACNKNLRIAINAATYPVRRDRPGVGSEIPGRITLQTSVDLQVGDFIEAEAWHDFPETINALPSGWAPVLWAHWEGTDL